MEKKVKPEILNSTGLLNQLWPVFYDSEKRLFVTVRQKDHEGKIVSEEHIPVNSKMGRVLLLGKATAMAKREILDKEWDQLIAVIKSNARERPTKEANHWNQTDPECQIEEAYASTTVSVPAWPDEFEIVRTSSGLKFRIKDSDGTLYSLNDPVVKSMLFDYLYQKKGGVEPKAWEEASLLKRGIAKAVREAGGEGKGDAKQERLDRETGVLAVVAMMAKRNAKKEGPYDGNQTEFRAALVGACEEVGLEKSELPNTRDFRDYYTKGCKELLRQENLVVDYERKAYRRTYTAKWIDGSKIPEWGEVTPSDAKKAPVASQESSDDGDLFEIIQEMNEEGETPQEAVTPSDTKKAPVASQQTSETSEVTEEQIQQTEQSEDTGEQTEEEAPESEAPPADQSVQVVEKKLPGTEEVTKIQEKKIPEAKEKAKKKATSEK